MNTIAYIIIAALLIDFIAGLIADLLNLKALKLEPPGELKGIYGEEEYRRSQQYTITQTKFGFVTGIFNLVLLLVFWFAGGFNWLDTTIREWDLPFLANGLLYIGILFTAHSLISLPFGIYATFVIEERFGFNKTTARTFVMDRIKGLVLGLTLGGALLTCVLSLFEYAGSIAWLYCWIALTLFILVIEFVAPVWIMPLFNKFTPVEEGELKKGILGYIKSVGYKAKGIFVIDGSKRSTKANAYFTGFGRTKRIALFDTLVDKYTVPEIVAVLAHEIGHEKKKHILQGLIISILHTGVMLYLLSLFMDYSSLYEAFYMDQASVYTGLLFFGLLYMPIEL
ncbi:M48 family metallopeptidase, partial [Chloroflexota bacterium]